MHIILCGLGQVGLSLAEHLVSDSRFHVAAIDEDPNLVERASRHLDLEAHVGKAAHPDILARAGAEKAEMLIAVTRQDEVNLTACQVAETLFHIPNRIARVRHPSYLDDKWSELFQTENTGATRIISPEREVARALLNRIRNHGAADVLPLAGGQALLMGLRAEAGTTTLGRPLFETAALFPNIEATLVARGRAGKITAVHREDHLEIDDIAYFVVRTDHAARLLRAFSGKEPPPLRRVVILGGGNVGINLMQDLHNRSLFQGSSLQTHERAAALHCQLVEKDPAQAMRAATVLESAGSVLQGDALDEDFFRSENLQNSDLVVSVTSSDEINLLSGILAKSLGCPRALAVISSPTLDGLADSLGLDGVLNPRELVFSSVLRHLRRGRILFLYALPHKGGEIFVAELLERGSSLLGRPLRELGLPHELRLGAVIREGEFITPRGTTELALGDTLILYAEAGERKRVEELLSVQFGFV